MRVTSKLLIVSAVLLSLSACGVPTAAATLPPASVAVTPPPATTTLAPVTPIPAPINAPLVDSPQFTNISMLNELEGWGVTDSAIVRTNDDGLTWHNVAPPGVTSLGYTVSHFFMDAAHAFFIIPDANDLMNRGTLYKTDNGGLTWTSNPLPFGDGDLHFLDSANGWAMVNLGAGAGSNAIAVYQTTDGGANWTRTYINDPTVSGAGNSLPLGGLKYGIVPLNMQTAWIGGTVYSSDTVYVYRTDDGGKTWSQIGLPAIPGAENSELDFLTLEFVTPTDAFLAMRVAGDATQLAVFVSHDGGNAWSLAPTLIPNGRDADFVSAAEGVVFNGDQFYVTRDAGQTWTIIPPDVIFSDSFASVDFVSVSTGWVTTMDPTDGRVHLYKTTDSGATWTVLGK